MTSAKMKVVALLVSLAMMLTLAACGGGGTNNNDNSADDSSNSSSATETAPIVLSGEVTGTVGQKYETRWFTFTINSLSVTDSIPELTAAAGNSLVVVNVTITNISGSTQPFGTFDWLVDDDSLAEYIFPIDPLNDKMMPAEFDLDDNKTVTYDVVVEYPSSLANPFFMYIEADENGGTYGTFKIPVK